MIMRLLLPSRRGQALTLVEVLVTIGVLIVVVVLLLPKLARPPRTRSSRIKCVNNLKNVGLAFRIFATDHNGRFPMQVSTNKVGTLESWKADEAVLYWQMLSNELSTPQLLVCPADKRTAAASLAGLRLEKVSYFLGLNGDEIRPQSFLAGDRNLTTNGVPVQTGLLPLTTNLMLGWTAGIHQHQGNVALGDGSVQQLSNTRLRDAGRLVGPVTNWLVIP